MSEDHPTYLTLLPNKRPRQIAADAGAEYECLQSRAFMDLEPKLSNLSSMTRITCQLAFAVGEQAGGDLKEEKGDLIFAARTLGEMVEELRRQWYASHKAAVQS
jgi:hypothetical protein